MSLHAERQIKTKRVGGCCANETAARVILCRRTLTHPQPLFSSATNDDDSQAMRSAWLLPQFYAYNCTLWEGRRCRFMHISFEIWSFHSGTDVLYLNILTANCIFKGNAKQLCLFSTQNPRPNFLFQEWPFIFWLKIFINPITDL